MSGFLEDVLMDEENVLIYEIGARWFHCLDNAYCFWIGGRPECDVIVNLWAKSPGAVRTL